MGHRLAHLATHRTVPRRCPTRHVTSVAGLPYVASWLTRQRERPAPSCGSVSMTGRGPFASLERPPPRGIGKGAVRLLHGWDGLAGWASIAEGGVEQPNDLDLVATQLGWQMDGDLNGVAGDDTRRVPRLPLCTCVGNCGACASDDCGSSQGDRGDDVACAQDSSCESNDHWRQRHPDDPRNARHTNE